MSSHGLQVDVNNQTARTGHMMVLAATAGVDVGLLRRVLQDNPAGNEDQQTPLVLVRPLRRG